MEENVNENRLSSVLKNVARLKGRAGLACSENRSSRARSGKPVFANAEPGQRLNEETENNNC